MPANMIRPDTGSRWKVSGNSIAMVAIGPMPGSTPIKVPTMAPRNAKPRLAGVSATPKPMARLLKNSMRSQFRPQRDREPQPRDEDRPRQDDQHHGRNCGFEWPQRTRRERADADQQHDRNHQPELFEAQREGADRNRHRQHGAP